MAELSRPPRLPSFLDGFLNLAGRPVPVVRLEHLFGLAEPPRHAGSAAQDLYTPLLILSVRGRSIALVAERVIETLTPAQFEIVPLEKHHSFNACARGIVRKGEAAMLLLSPERILLDAEMTCLDEYQAVEQMRLQAIADAAAEEQG